VPLNEGQAISATEQNVTVPHFGSSRMDEAITKLPAIQRSRPIDATGWFWSFVLLFAGLFYSQIWPVVGVLLLLASPVCFIWQFKKWRGDSAISRQAVAWCHEHYAAHGDLPVADFIVALAHDTSCNLSQLTPETPLDKINWMSDDDHDVGWNTGYSNRHQIWLANVLRVARIPATDLSDFSGVTLHDAIHFVATSNNAK
jgi:hypothetical protein